MSSEEGEIDALEFEEAIGFVNDENSDEDNESVTSESPVYSTSLRKDVLITMHDALDEMYQQDELTDLEVRVQDKTFKCHKVIMAAVSSYFRSLLKSGMQESQEGVVELKEDINKNSFGLLLRYIYRGEDVVNHGTVGDLLALSVILQVKPLERECETLMSSNLSPSNCIGVWRAAQTFGCRSLCEKSWSILLKHFDEVSRLDEFLSLDKADLVAILEDDRLPQQQEDAICDAVLEWVKTDLTTREEHLDELITYVCLPKVSGGFLFDKVLREEELLARSPKFREMKDDALEYHLKPDTKIAIMAKQMKIRDEAVLRKVVVLIGGYYLSEEPLTCMLTFDLKREKWFTVASMNHEPGEDFATCVFQNEVYLSGGARSRDIFFKYSPVTNDWLPQPALMTGRECHAMVTIDDFIYVIGGRSSDVEDNNGLVTDIEAYNTKKGQWTKVGKMELPLESMSAVVINDKVFTFGGLDEHRQPSSAIQCFDPATGECILQGSLPEPSEMSVAVAIKSTSYVVTSTGKAFRFDPTDASVHRVADFGPRTKFGVYTEGQSIVVVGGEDESKNMLTDEVIMIDVRSGKVDKAGNLPIPFGGFKMEHLVVPIDLLAQEGFNVMGQNLFDLEYEVMQQKKSRHFKKLAAPSVAKKVMSYE